LHQVQIEVINVVCMELSLFFFSFVFPSTLYDG
jgi:hypothetical protein